METLKGGREIKVTFEDGAESLATVSQIKVRDYERAILVADDEAELAAICLSLPKDRVVALTPESFEAVVSAVREVNAGGFFAYFNRRVASMVERLNRMKPEALQAMQPAKPSSNTYSGLQPRP